VRTKVNAAKRKPELKRVTLLSVDECAEIGGNSAFWWRRAAYSGRVSSVKLGTSLRISLEEVNRIIAENTRPRVA